MLLPLCIIAAWVTFASTRCPSGSLQGLASDQCYLYVKTPTTWFAAEELCSSKNGHLASVSSALTNSMLTQHTGICGTAYTYYWLGGSQLIGGSGKWEWVDGQRFSYKNWATGKWNLWMEAFYPQV